MCESAIYINGEKDFEDVVLVELEGTKVVAKDILGEERRYDLKPVRVDLINNRIDLE